MIKKLTSVGSGIFHKLDQNIERLLGTLGGLQS